MWGDTFDEVEVVVSVGLQRDRRLEHVAILSMFLEKQDLRCVCKYLEHLHEFSFLIKCFPTVVFQ